MRTAQRPCLAEESAPRGIAVNGVAPGRVGLPDDIGGAISLLLQSGNGWINGQRIEASGGMFL